MTAEWSRQPLQSVAKLITWQKFPKGAGNFSRHQHTAIIDLITGQQHTETTVYVNKTNADHSTFFSISFSFLFFF